MSSSLKISIVGTESTGKTVFLAALTHTLASQKNLPRISAQNVLTVRYTAGIYDQLELGKWPKSTEVGVRQNLRWHWHTHDQNQHELQTFDCAGQDFRTIFESESDDELNPQQLALKKEFYASHLIILLINLQRSLDIYKVPGKNKERIDIEFAPAAAVRKLRQNGVTIYALFTQYDRYRERIEREWNGDISLALQVLLPDLYSALVESGSPFDAIAAIETEVRDGEVFPKIGCQPGDISGIIKGIDEFLVRNAPIFAQREQEPPEIIQHEQQEVEQHAQQRENEGEHIVPLKNTEHLSQKTTVPPPLPQPQLSFTHLLPLKPNESRAKKAVFMIWVILIMDVVMLISDLMQYALLCSGNITRQTAESNDARVQLLGIIHAVLYVISGITFIRWFWRSYENVKLFCGETRFGTGWACGAWFTPLISLWRPYQIMKDILQKTNKFSGKNGKDSTLEMAVIRGWWFLWILSSILGQILLRNTDTSLSSLQAMSVISILNNFIGVPLALLTILLIKRITNIKII